MRDTLVEMREIVLLGKVKFPTAFSHHPCVWCGTLNGCTPFPCPSACSGKGDEDDGNSLFGGLGGAALPVFTDESNDHNDFDHSGSGTEQAAKIPVAPASSVRTVASPPLSSGE